MRFSKWHAHGNVYLLAETAELTPERVREAARGTDGIVQVVGVGNSSADIVIWNPDGTTAELSGNGTRIAARWLARRSGAARVTIRVGPRKDRKSTRLNSSHANISYAVFCLKKKKNTNYV